MNLSLGIMAYDEEANIGSLITILLNQKLEFLKEIIVINDGSTDKTAEIVQKFAPQVKLITLKERQGKVAAINQFLKEAKSEILALESADTIPHKDAFKNLMEQFKNPKVGLVGSQIIPQNKGSNFIEYFGKYIYKLHHNVAIENPKFGELIAFRNVIIKLPISSVDEELIAMILKKKGYQMKYCPESIVYNIQPKNLKDIVNQRRRIHAGHIALASKGYAVSTASFKNCSKAVLSTFKFRDTFKIIGSISLEAYTRFLGLYDYLVRGEKKHFKWERINSTKRNIIK